MEPRRACGPLNARGMRLARFARSAGGRWVYTEAIPELLTLDVALGAQIAPG